jgi:hypothetical protein
MGIWEQMQQEKTTFDEVSFVNERHQRIGRVNIQTVRKAFDLDVVEIMRGDLAKVLYERTSDEVEYCFGDSIQELKQDEEAVAWAHFTGWFALCALRVPARDIPQRANRFVIESVFAAIMRLPLPMPLSQARDRCRPA